MGGMLLRAVSFISRHTTTRIISEDEFLQQESALGTAPECLVIGAREFVDLS